jgi:hypothetical protein
MISTANPHATTAAQAGAVANAGTLPSMKSGLDASKGSAGAQGNVYIATDTQTVYISTGSAWAKVAVANYTNLDNKPVAAGLPNMFQSFMSGSTTLAPDSTSDILRFAAGSGITLTPNTTTDTITISASTGGGGVSAHTHAGSDVTSAVSDSNSLDAINGGKFPAILNTSGSATVSPPANGPFYIKPGSVNVSFTAGIGVISLGVTMNGVLTMLAANGDYDAFTGHIMLKDSTSTSITVKSNPTVTQTLRVNYIVIYW